MAKIQINNLNIEQFSTLTENEVANIQGGALPNGTISAIGLVGIAIGAATLFPVAATIAAGAAVISAGIGIYEALE